MTIWVAKEEGATYAAYSMCLLRFSYKPAPLDSLIESPWLPDWRWSAPQKSGLQPRM